MPSPAARPLEGDVDLNPTSQGVKRLSALLSYSFTRADRVLNSGPIYESYFLNSTRDPSTEGRRRWYRIEEMLPAIRK